MARLIDADKINYHDHTEYMGHGDFETVRTVTDKEIAEIPTVYAVEVVRCDVCKNAEPYDCTIHGTIRHLYKCKKDEGAIGYKKVVSNYDFCSCGKRKDGDD